MARKSNQFKDCRACGHECYVRAKTCPNCGKSNPTQARSGCTSIALGMFVIGILFAALVSREGQTPDSNTTHRPQSLEGASESTDKVPQAETTVVSMDCLDVALPKESPDGLGNVYSTERTSFGDGLIEVAYSVQGACVDRVEKTIYAVDPSKMLERARVLQRELGATNEDMAILATAVAELHEHLLSPAARDSAMHMASADRVVDAVCRRWILVTAGERVIVTQELWPESQVPKCGA